MKIKEILDQYYQANIELTIADDGEHLLVAPVEHLTDSLIETLRQHKTGLLLWLKMEPEKWETIHHEDGQIEFFRSGDGDSGDKSSLKPEENGTSVASALEKKTKFDDLPELKFCPKCGGWRWWQSLAKTWRCQTCDPPSDHAKWFVCAAAAIRNWYQTRGTPLHGASLAKLLRMATKATALPSLNHPHCFPVFEEVATGGQ